MLRHDTDEVLLIRQNYAERMQSHCKTTRLSANSPTTVSHQKFDPNLLIYLISLIRKPAKLLMKYVNILQFC